MKLFFVYVDWTTEETPRPFYVGKGTIRRVRLMTPRNQLHERIIAKHGRERRIEFASVDEQAALDHEKTLIAHYATFIGWGANLTEGGEGVTGGKWTLSADACARRRAWNTGLRRSDETIKRMSAATSLRAADPEWRRKLRDAAQLRCTDPAWLKKNADARRGAKRSDAARQRMRDAWVRRKMRSVKPSDDACAINEASK